MKNQTILDNVPPTTKKKYRSLLANLSSNGSTYSRDMPYKSHPLSSQLTIKHLYRISRSMQQQCPSVVELVWYDNSSNTRNIGIECPSNVQLKMQLSPIS